MSARDELDSASLRIPPHSVEAEQSVLGGLLLENSAWDRAGDVVSAADFYRTEHRQIFAAISSLVAATKPADVITVFEHLKRSGKADECGGMVYLNSLASSVPSASNMRRYAEIVRERALLRKMIATSDQLTSEAWACDDPSTLIDRAATAFADLQQGTLRQVPQPASALIVRAADRWTDLQAGTAPAGISTGFPVLDAELNGGWRPGGLYVLAARASVGKSSLSQAFGIHAALREEQCTLIVSMEMTSQECMDRAAANVGGVDYRNIQTGQLSDMEWGSLSEAIEAIGRAPLYVDDEGSLTLAKIRAKAVSLRREGLQLLVLDYLQLADYGSHRGQTTNDAVATLSKGLKRLAKDLGLAIVVLSQLNRAVEARASPKPMLSDLRDSGAIEQDADVVLMLWRVRQFETRSIMGLWLPKNRQGKAGSEIALEFQGRYQRWFESDADIRPQPNARAARDDL